MKAIIFSAGLGTRFKPWTDKHPKALAIVNGKSLLQRNIKYLQQFGIDEVIVNVHHFADQIEAAVRENNGWGSKVHFSDERNMVLETGGGLLKASSELRNDTFVAINVDILTDLRLDEMIERHHSCGALATLAVSERSTSRYFLFDQENRLAGWRNISTGAEIIRREAISLNQKAFSGVHVVDPAIFSMTHLEGKFSMVDLYLELCDQQPIIGFDHTGSNLIDVGKPESVLKAEAIFQ